MEIVKSNKNFGNHIILDLHESDINKLYFSEEIMLYLEHIISSNNGTIQNMSYHVFPNNAYTILFLLSESHVSFHTFPENNYIAIDIFSCGQNILTYNITTLLIHYFKSTKPIVKQVIRNNFCCNEIQEYKIGDYMSNESMKNIIFNNCNILLNKKTPYQNLTIIENKEYGKILLLDNYIMHINTIDKYSEYMISSIESSITSNSNSNILIIGGGDFIIANYLIKKYSNLDIKIDIVDIDKEVSDAVIEHFQYTLPLNCNIKYQCGYEYIKTCEKKYDAVILDITDPDELLNTPASVLISEDFYTHLLKCTNVGANIIQQYGSYAYACNKTNLKCCDIENTKDLHEKKNIFDNVILPIFPNLIKNQYFTTKYIDEYFDELIFLHIKT